MLMWLVSQKRQPSETISDLSLITTWLISTHTSTTGFGLTLSNMLCDYNGAPIKWPKNLEGQEIRTLREGRIQESSLHPHDWESDHTYYLMLLKQYRPWCFLDSELTICTFYWHPWDNFGCTPNLSEKISSSQCLFVLNHKPDMWQFQ
jgi:hypothetical protein